MLLNLRAFLALVVFLAYISTSTTLSNVISPTTTQNSNHPNPSKDAIEIEQLTTLQFAQQQNSASPESTCDGGIGCADRTVEYSAEEELAEAIFSLLGGILSIPKLHV
jgi:predicted neutral ceramidase superfamily lipid hydrolase|tara:strand:+ start:29 stop:352 length:324 start_codon:yes stop_codon:yes gene_type:complete